MKKLWPFDKSKARRTCSSITSSPSQPLRAQTPYSQFTTRPSMRVEQSQHRPVKQHSRSLRSQPVRSSVPIEEQQQFHRHEQGRLSSKRDRMPSDNDPWPLRQQPVKTSRKSAEQRPRPSIDSPVSTPRKSAEERPRPSMVPPEDRFPQFRAVQEEKARKKVAWREMLCREANARQQDIDESMEIEMARRAEFEVWERHRRIEEEQQALEDSYEQFVREQEQQERITSGKFLNIVFLLNLFIFLDHEDSSHFIAPHQEDHTLENLTEYDIFKTFYLYGYSPIFRRRRT